MNVLARFLCLAAGRFSPVPFGPPPRPRLGTFARGSTTAGCPHKLSSTLLSGGADFGACGHPHLPALATLTRGTIIPIAHPQYLVHMLTQGQCQEPLACGSPHQSVCGFFESSNLSYGIHFDHTDRTLARFPFPCVESNKQALKYLFCVGGFNTLLAQKLRDLSGSTLLRFEPAVLQCVAQLLSPFR